MNARPVERDFKPQASHSCFARSRWEEEGMIDELVKSVRAAESGRTRSVAM